MSAPVQDSFGQLLRRYRLAAGYSQERLAALSRLGVHTIADLERGVSLFPHAHTVESLADSLHLTGSTRVSFLSAARRPSAATSQGQEPARTSDIGAPDFVGRASELATGARFLAGEGPCVLLFAGEPGIGKSRLLRELAIQARGSGWRVVAGGCDQRRGREPYAPFVETLDESLLATSPSRRKGDLKECDWLARLGPELAKKIRTPVPEWSLTPEQERRMIFAAVHRYLLNIAGPAGTVLILDDLQWAGPDALDLLAFLVRTHAIEAPTDSSPRAALRVLGAYRTSEVQSGHPLENLIVDLAHDERVSLYDLQRLSAAEARSLATSLVGAALDAEQWVTDVVARADGVPFYLVNFAQAFRPGVDAAPLADERTVVARGLKVPWLVTATIRCRLSALPPDAQETLALAAIIRRVAPFELLRHTRKSSGDELTLSLEAACRAQLLEDVSSSVAAYRFTHDLIRETVFASLSKARQALLHRIVADTLEQLPEPERIRHIAALADHLTQAGEPARALPYVLLAGDQAAAVYAHSGAERHFRVAASLAADLGDRAREAEALEKLGGAIHLLGRHVEAADGWQGALRDYQDLHDPLGELRALAGLLLSQAEVGREKLDETVALARTILARIEPPDGAGLTPSLGLALAGTHSNLGWILWTSGRYADAQVDLRKAVALAHAVDDEAQLAQAQFRLLISGGAEATAEAFEETLALAERSGQTAMVVTSHNMAGIMYEDAGDFARALAHMEQAVAMAERRQDPRHLAWQLNNFAGLLFDYGDWGRMRDLATRSTTIMREADRHGETWQSAGIALWPGYFALIEGREEEGERLLEEAMVRIGQVGSVFLLQHPTCRLAEVDLLAGRADVARQRLTTLLDDPHPTPAENKAREPLLFLAWAEMALGKAPLAEARMRTVLANASPLFRTQALRIQGLLATRQEHWEAGVAALEEAVASAHAMPFPYAELKALWVYGQLEAARGDPTAARRRFEEGLAICDRLGEGLYRRYITRELSTLSNG
jgi:tetratricopeptide (TPR) repeat protein/transcriptional regulator with XRE-family HTH domain